MKTLTQKVFVNTSVQLAGKVITTLIGIVTFGLLTRFLGVAGYGEYTTVFAYNSLLVILADFGFALITLKEISLATGLERKKVFQNALALRLGFGAIIMVLMLLIVPFLAYPLTLKIGIALIAISLLWQAQYGTILSYLQVEYQMFKAVAADIAGRLFILVGLIWVLQMGYGIAFVFTVTVLGFLVTFLCSLAAIYKDKVYGFRFDRLIVLRIARESFWMGLVIVFSFIYFKIDTIILSFMKSSVDVGIYGAPFKVLEILLAVPHMFLGNVFPALSESAKNNLGKFANLVTRSITGLTAIALPIVVGGVILAEPIIRIAAGDEYATTSTIAVWGHSITAPIVMQILLFALLLSFFVGLFNLGMVVSGRQRELIWPYILASIVNVVANIVLVPKFSYLAAAINSLASELIIFLLALYLLRQTLKFNLDFLALGKMMLSALIMGVVVYLLRESNVLLVVAIGAGVYGVLFFRVFRILGLRELIR
jgi:O-antigen/teichoic acid export membrane protein